MNPWLNLLIALVFGVVAGAFVLPSQGIPNGIKVSPRTAAWVTAVTSLISFGFIVHFVWIVIA